MRAQRENGSMDSSDYSSPPSSPTDSLTSRSRSSSLTSSLTSSLGSQSLASPLLIPQPIEESDILRLSSESLGEFSVKLGRKNLMRMNRLYSVFTHKIKRSLRRNAEKFDEFKEFFSQKYSITAYKDDSKHVTPTDSLEQSVDNVFSYGLKHLGWKNFMNSEFLLEAVEGLDDESVSEAKEKFQDDLQSHLFTIRISDYIEQNIEKITEFKRKVDVPVLDRNDRLEEKYRHEVTLKLKFKEGDMTEHTLGYLEKLWRDLRASGNRLLPKISTILDCICYGSLWIRWIVLSEEVFDRIPDQVKLKEIIDVFEKYHIVRFELDGKCLYSSVADDSSASPLPPLLPIKPLRYYSEHDTGLPSDLTADTSTSTLIAAEDDDEPVVALKPLEPPPLHVHYTPPLSPPSELASGEKSDSSDSSQEEKSEGFWSLAWKALFRKTTVSIQLIRECKKKTPDIEKVKEYLADKDCDVRHRERDEFKWDAFMWACDMNHFEIAKLLLKHKPDLNIKDKKKWTPLVMASRAGDLEIVKGVVELSRDPEQGLSRRYINKATNKKWTPLMWAAHRGHAKVVEYLISQGAKVDSKDINGWTPLMQASQEGHADVVEILLKYKADPNHQVETKWTALMAAAKNKHLEVADILLNNGAKVDLRRKDDSTALQVASYYEGNSEVIKLLLAHGAEVDHFTENGFTALMLATERGYKDMVTALVEGGADPNLQHRGTGWTPLFFAAKRGFRDVSEELISYKAHLEVEGRKVFEIAAQYNKGRILDGLNKLYNEQPLGNEAVGSSVDPDPDRPFQPTASVGPLGIKPSKVTIAEEGAILDKDLEGFTSRLKAQAEGDADSSSGSSVDPPLRATASAGPLRATASAGPLQATASVRPFLGTVGPVGMKPPAVDIAEDGESALVDPDSRGFSTTLETQEDF